MSADPVESHKKFIEENSLPFIILSDSREQGKGPLRCMGLAWNPRQGDVSDRQRRGHQDGVLISDPSKEACKRSSEGPERDQ